MEKKRHEKVIRITFHFSRRRRFYDESGLVFLANEPMILLQKLCLEGSVDRDAQSRRQGNVDTAAVLHFRPVLRRIFSTAGHRAER